MISKYFRINYILNPHLRDMSVGEESVAPPVPPDGAEVGPRHAPVVRETDGNPVLEIADKSPTLYLFT